MENNYQYLDPEYKYTNKNGVLHNLANIVNERILIAFESLKVSKRVEELWINCKSWGLKTILHQLSRII
jgi:hypothetical protein